MGSRHLWIHETGRKVHSRVAASARAVCMLEVPGPLAGVVASNGYHVVLEAGETQYPASDSS